MNIHYLQHVPFEGLGSMAAALLSRGHELTSTRLWAGDPLPAAADIEGLIVMGGPMGVHDDAEHPWLRQEKQFIRKVIDSNTPVLGICLGAQLIADALGADVFKNRHREIGWFPIVRSPSISGTILDDVLPDRLEVFHWHGDTFELPGGCLPIASSAACRQQGFVYEDRVVALQFHLETTEKSARALIDHCGDDLDNSRFVQRPENMLSDPARFDRINQVMRALLDKLANST